MDVSRMQSIGFMFLILSVIILVAMFLISTKQLRGLVNYEGYTDDNTYTLTYYKKKGCPFCDQFEPQWAKVDSCIKNFLQLDGRNCAIKVKVVLKDVMAHVTDIDKYGIEGVPEVVLLKPDGTHHKYDKYAGQMNATNVINWLNRHLPCRITCSAS